MMEDDFDYSIFICQECGSDIEGYGCCLECNNLSDETDIKHKQ